MELVVALLVFLLLIAPAIRLIGVALRTRRTPELWGALFFLGTGIGIPLRLIGHAQALADPAAAAQLNAIGHAFFAAGSVAMTTFTWRVFRPAAAWARLLAALMILGILGSTTLLFLTGATSNEQSLAMAVTNATRVAPMAWAFVESLRYFRAMRRRSALGLADPVVTNRFLLWSCWVGGLALLPTLTLSLRLLGRLAAALGMSDAAAIAQSPLLGATLRAIFLASGLLAAVALSLSFSPPKRYLRLVQRRAARAEV